MSIANVFTKHLTEHPIVASKKCFRRIDKERLKNMCFVCNHQKSYNLKQEYLHNSCKA